MLTIQGAPQHLCDRISRRDLLRLGALGGFGLTLPKLLQAADQPGSREATFGRADRCLLLFLTGGPPQHDTWDPKLDAPAEIRGELNPSPQRCRACTSVNSFPAWPVSPTSIASYGR
ncbi:MAG: hypothetical protein HY000_26600 [Planctomycetes bacterium]|nr:hypothetical protein [Planctomycetota bacterium]